MFLSKELLAQIDEYRFTNRFASRTEAIRFLLEQALKQKPKTRG